MAEDTSATRKFSRGSGGRVSNADAWHTGVAGCNRFRQMPLGRVCIQGIPFEVKF